MEVTQQQTNPTEKKQCSFLGDDFTRCSGNTIDNSDFCAQHHEYPHDIDIFKAIHDSLLQDLREYWTRTNFYFLVQGALLAAFTTVASSKNNNIVSIKPFLCILGFVITCVWFLVAFLSIHFMNRWRTQMLQINEVIDRHHFHTPVVKVAMRKTTYLPKVFTPTGVTLFLPVLFAASWLYLLIFFHPS